MDWPVIGLDGIGYYVVYSVQLYEQAANCSSIIKKDMEFPKFLLADNTDFPASVFVVHIDYPRFVIDLKTDEVEWLEEFSREDEEELATLTEELIEQATAFYDREISRYEG